MKLTPIEPSSSKQYSLQTSYSDIVQKVFPPNIDDDQTKVQASWGFEDEQGRKAAIWSWKYHGNLNNLHSWSAWGDADLLREIFGNNSLS